MGHHDPRRLGIRHRQFRLVDRYRPRRNADLGHLAAPQTGLAYVHQSLRGSYDVVRRGASRHVPHSPHGPPVAGLLASAVSQFHVALAAAAQSAGVGRFRCHHLPHRLAHLLVHRPGPRSGNNARQGQTDLAESYLRNVRARLARIRPPLGTLSNGLPVVRRLSHAAGGFGPHSSQLRLRH